MYFLIYQFTNLLTHKPYSLGDVSVLCSSLYCLLIIFLSVRSQNCSETMIKRTFGHCSVRWKIRNFCLETFREEHILCSPEFTIRIPEATEWEMALETSSGQDSIFFHLKRLNSGPRIVWVNWTIDLKDSSGNTVVDYECESVFERIQKHVLDLESVSHIRDILTNGEIDSIEIACSIFVKCESNGSEREPKVNMDTGLDSLSHDLRRLLKRGKYYDVVIRIGNTDIRAHKSILTKRNDNLGKMISNAKKSKIVPLTAVNSEAVEAVITYLYTGNLQCILRNPSFALYECIEFFEVEELKPYFLPENVHISSTIQVDEVCFRVIVPNFNLENDIIRSQELIRNNLNSTWRLHIYPYGYDSSSEFITILAEVVSATDIEVACVELSVLDACNEIFAKARIIGHLVAGEWFAFEHFMDRRFLGDILKKNQLRIALKIRTSKSVHNSTIVSKRSTSQVEIRTLPHYLTLSAEMKSMLYGLLYKDVILKAKEGDIFHAHRCVLAARSKTFANLLAKPSDDIVVNMEANILRALLQYIYSGVLEELQVTELFQLYKVAEEYNIYALKFDCCKFLLSKLDVKNMHEIFAFADENRERHLKLTSHSFIEAYKNYTPDDPS